MQATESPITETTAMARRRSKTLGSPSLGAGIWSAKESGLGILLGYFTAED
jgi:hypothetical protein